MSETLSYQEPVPTELNESEQDSLAVGEQMEAEQNQLLAGKYKSASDLEKAYLELQQKLGVQNNEEEQEVGEAEDEPTESEEPVDKKEEEKPKPKSLTEADIEYLHGLAGGSDGYSQMINWASSNINAKEIQMYDSVMEGGDPAAVLFAVKALVAQYKEAVGSDGQLLTGKSAPNEANRGFRSQQELISAMSDPRYDNDPAYRSDVIKKLESSDIEF